MAAKMSMEGTSAKDAKTTLDIMQRSATLFDFQKCVADHNLFEDDGETVKIDFSKPRCLDILDPRVGEEIASLIDKQNNFEEDDEGN
jgi:hypothetical protein